MNFKITGSKETRTNIIIVETRAQAEALNLFSKEELAYITAQYDAKKSLVNINQYKKAWYIYFIKEQNTSDNYEQIRVAGARLQGLLQEQKTETVLIDAHTSVTKAAYYLAEGLALAGYQFLKYRKDAAGKTHTLKNILFTKKAITQVHVEQLGIVAAAVAKARTLVNEPLNYMTAVQLSKEFVGLGKEAGFKVTVYNKAKIEKEKMGGILAVNRGSIQEPTFTVMEYKAPKALNKAPIVLVGKGIVYDTGGLSLKPTPSSMDRMKSDMSGSALVAAAMYAIARLKLPLHVYALVPATENRPGEDAYVPGDIITMYDGTNVEVLNTDAEGRLVLADALHWAKRYKPELVLDFATLTGAASAAIGEYGIVCMGNASADKKEQLRQSGESQYERLVEFPMWSEYGDLIKSDIADLKNIGGPTGGAITAGKFLEHFTDYPWMHFDIAGVSFSLNRKKYITSGGTAFGLRMLIDFLQNYTRN